MSAAHIEAPDRPILSVAEKGYRADTSGASEEVSVLAGALLGRFGDGSFWRACCRVVSQAWFNIDARTTMQDHITCSPWTWYLSIE